MSDQAEPIGAEVVVRRFNLEKGVYEYGTPDPKAAGAEREVVARAIEISIVERTTHHPVRKHLERLQWLWPLVADAVVALRAVDAAPGGGVPAGMMLVPIEARRIYRAILSPTKEPRDD